jgi:Uma2 family endonuclease
MSRPAVLATNLSVDEFLAYPTPDGNAELVRGEIRVSRWPGAAHGSVVAEIFGRLFNHVTERRLGRLFTNAGFELLELPRTVRVPDIAFVRADRLPADGLGPRPLRIAPDLAVEVLSPSETRARIREKLDDYRASRIPLVWLIDPRARTVTVVEGELPDRRLGESDTLDGGEVVRGFSCEIRELFVGLAKR